MEWLVVILLLALAGSNPVKLINGFFQAIGAVMAFALLLNALK